MNHQKVLERWFEDARSQTPISRGEGLLKRLPWWPRDKDQKETMQEMHIQPQGQEDPLEKETATYSSVPAWETPWTEEPGGLQSMRLQKVGHDKQTKQQLPE